MSAESNLGNDSNQDRYSNQDSESNQDSKSNQDSDSNQDNANDFQRIFMSSIPNLARLVFMTSKTTYPLSAATLQNISTIKPETEQKDHHFPDIFPVSQEKTISGVKIINSSQGQFKIVIHTKRNFMGILFYKRTWSNFSSIHKDLTIGTHTVHFPYTESVFKAGCFACHSADGLCEERDIEKVFQATEPAKVKSSTKGIKKFTPILWDKQSLDVMHYAVALRVTGVEEYNQMKFYAKIAQDNGIHLHDVFFVECTDKDKIWASGEEIDMVAGKLQGIAPDQGYMDVVTAHGKNWLGLCLTHAFRVASDTASLEDYTKWFEQDVPNLFTQV